MAHETRFRKLEPNFLCFENNFWLVGRLVVGWSVGWLVGWSVCWLVVVFVLFLCLFVVVVAFSAQSLFCIRHAWTRLVLSTENTVTAFGCIFHGGT